MSERDERIRARVSKLEGKAKDLLKDGRWDAALEKIELAMDHAERMDDRTLGLKLISKYDKIENGENPYKKSSGVLYSLVFGAFALGGFLLLGNVTGGVVGWADVGSRLLGAVLFAMGVIGALVLICKSR
jgi:hypothetical protein